MRRKSLHLAGLVAAGAILAGCEREERPATQPASQPAPARLTLLAPGTTTWSHAEACQRLPDPQLGLSAAVRLVQLSGLTPLCVPPNLTDETFQHLRLTPLNEVCWALGLAPRGDERELRAALLVGLDGRVEPLAEGFEEELLVLHVAKEPAVFPHVAVLPTRVLVIAGEPEPALVLEPDQPLRFALRQRAGYPYVALLLATAATDREVAAYRWDPYEEVFMGPAVAKLPDPPGGKLRVDMRASRRFEPQGGELPEPAPIRPLPPASQPEPVDDDHWPV